MNDAGEGWFVADADGAARGPLRRQQLQAEREAGRIGDDSLVWTLALAEWIPLRRALGGAAAGTPGPLPQEAPKPATPPRQTARKMPRPQPPIPGTAPVRASDDWRDKGRSAAAAAEALAGATKQEQAAKQALALQAVRRWLARAIDTVLLGGVGWALLSLAGWKLGTWVLAAPSVEMADSLLLALIVLVLAAAPLEMVALGLSGRTPGRALLGLRVASADGRLPGLRAAAERVARTSLYGQALWVFPFAPIAWGIGFATLLRDGRSHWDRATGLKVIDTPIVVQHWWSALVALAVAWAMLVSDTWMKLAWELAAP